MVTFEPLLKHLVTLKNIICTVGCGRVVSVYVKDILVIVSDTKDTEISTDLSIKAMLTGAKVMVEMSVDL